MRTRFPVVVFALILTSLGPTGLAQQPSLEARKVLRRSDPVYPSIAKRMNLAGTVKLIAVVSPDGKVKTVEPVGGSPVLLEAAKEAVTNWKYAPGGAESREVVEFHFNPGTHQ